MPRRNDSWGIEIGSFAVKAMRLLRHGSRVELAEYEVLPFKQVLTTPDLNVEEAIQVTLDKFLAKHDVSKTNVVVSVPGHMAFARFAKLPPVEPKKIPDIVRFEAVQQIPFPIEQVEWDYQVFQQEDSPDVEVGIFAITKERVLAFLNNLLQVGLRVDSLTLSPLAVYNAFSFDNAEDPDVEGTVYMDIGTQCTDVIIVEGGGIWLRTLPIGGNNFTEALLKAFKLSFSKAEKLKREAGTSKYARQIFQAMRPVFADLVQEMQRSVGYFQSINRDAKLNRLVGIGSTFRLPGMQKFLKQQLQMDVTRTDRFKRIGVNGKQEAEFAEKALKMATAYGLALQGLGMESVSANILPRHIIQQRFWRAKQPWIGAAAACIAIGCGLAGVRYFSDHSTYEASFSDNDPEVRKVVGSAKAMERKMQDLSNSDTDPRKRIENLRRILDYRDLWPKLLEDISLAAAALEPQPETLKADYEAIGHISRATRRRFYIDSITAEYKVGPDLRMAGDRSADMGPMQDISKEYTSDYFWDEESWGVMSEFDDDDDDDGLYGSDSASDGDTAEQTISAPRFVMIVRGTTPRHDATKFLTDTFIKWLEDNVQRRNRPYRLVLEKPIITERWDVDDLIDPMEADASGDPRTVRRGDRSARSRRSTRSGHRQRTMGGMHGGMSDMMLMDPGSRMGGSMRGMPMAPRGTGKTALPGDQGSLIPSRPLADERRRDDKGFEIRWTVELLKPEEARIAENPPLVEPPTSPETAEGPESGHREEPRS